jgi:DNA-3-methyladenine glycosylase
MVGNRSLIQMKPRKILSREFYDRPVLEVARELLGMRLVRVLDGQRIAGIILETEGYDGESDLACHAHVGRTKRNEVMFGTPGHAYVYFTYGMHWLLNCVTGRRDYPAAVLIRAIQPFEGIDLIAKNRLPAMEKDWCNGPAKLAKALQIDKTLNGMDLCSNKSPLFIEEDLPFDDENVQILMRVGIDAVPEPWRSKPWRFLASRRRR